MCPVFWVHIKGATPFFMPWDDDYGNGNGNGNGNAYGYGNGNGFAPINLRWKNVPQDQFETRMEKNNSSCDSYGEIVFEIINGYWHPYFKLR